MNALNELAPLQSLGSRIEGMLACHYDPHIPLLIRFQLPSKGFDGARPRKKGLLSSSTRKPAASLRLKPYTILGGRMWHLLINLA